MAANAKGKPLAGYAPLFALVTDANDAVKFEDDCMDLLRGKWLDSFERLSNGLEHASFGVDEAAEMACRLIVESVGESAQKEYDLILENSGHSIDWGHVEQFAERVGYMRHDHLRHAFEKVMRRMNDETEVGSVSWESFAEIMTTMEKAHKAEMLALEHPRMTLNVHVSSPRIVLTADPESDLGTQLLVEPGNIAIATFFAGEIVIVGVSREVRQHGSEQQTEFINAVQSDIANALGVPLADVCHVTVSDATVPAPEGEEHAELRHLLRLHRDEFSESLQSYDVNNDGFLDPSEIISALQTLAWDVNEAKYDRFSKIVLEFLDANRDGKLSLCEMKDDLASNRAVRGRTDCRVRCVFFYRLMLFLC